MRMGGIQTCDATRCRKDVAPTSDLDILERAFKMKRLSMKTLLIPVLLLALSLPAFAAGNNNGGGGNNNGGGGNNNNNYSGAPGPVIGAGLPLLLIGGGIYWLARRRKKQPNFQDAADHNEEPLACFS